MRQNLAYEFGQVLGEVDAVGLFVSLCTIQQRTNTVSAVRQPNLTNWLNRAGLVNIPCMRAVEVPLRPDQAATARLAQQFDTRTIYHVLLNGFYPQILQSNQAVIDGLPYEIMAVESDSLGTQTRLAIRTWTL